MSAAGSPSTASMLKPKGLDPGRKYPLIVYVYGEPASQTVVDRWGGCTGAVPPRPRRGRLHRGQLRQPRHAGAEGRGLAEGDLRKRRRSVVEGTGGRRSRVGRASSVHRPHAGRNLGLERRRLEHAQCDVSVSRCLRGGGRGRASPRSTAVRHHLSGTLHGPPAGQRRRLSCGFSDQFCGRPEGSPADRAWLGRRQRALSRHRAAGQSSRRARQAVRPDGLSQSHALPSPRGRARRPMCIS